MAIACFGERNNKKQFILMHCNIQKFSSNERTFVEDTKTSYTECLFW